MSSINNPGKPPKEIAFGSYTGDDAATRQIALGFKCSHFIVYKNVSTRTSVICIGLKSFKPSDSTDQSTHIFPHATDGIDLLSNLFNGLGIAYYYWAISE
ncbi:hypothetical protein ES703_73599 [subsurface metagenome]